MKKTRILIIGGGYGGLKSALTLQKRHVDAEVTLISKHDYHYQTTLLHKVAIGTLSERKAKIYYRPLLKSVRFIKDKAMEICPEENKVIGKLDTYHYDILVIALGFKPDLCGIKGVQEHAYKLSSLNAALRLCRNIEWKFKDYHVTKDKNNLSFIVCGTGFTGIEFTAELAHDIKRVCAIYGLNKEDIKITCVGRSSRILPVFEEKLSQVAERKLRDLGVEIVNNASVEECQEDGIIITRNGKQEKIFGNTILWSTGVKGNDTVEYYSKMESKKGRIKVDSQLKNTNYDNVYVVGDCAIFGEKDAICAPTAQIASQMGEYIGNLLADKLEGKEIKKDFHFINRGSICSIGHLDAVGIVFKKNISGKFAAFMKNVVENRWLFGIGGLKMMLKKGQFRYRSSD
ncbi:NAD(P)/FAD-dependent oxidoreductase [Helicobacter mustelae]|uniref:Putative pyridine nucleotide-disulphide oxidoreductase n=1 Tax=Helicobacter mustelae (strain ATCC 43772 / CCUG 25715 / CIP 103759 / LMG 18044 / NCTC 12198 / R85-136P) TaxID=679897 RepID=D3UI60_HELM1|nr:NAD(P)/FAD-dependent oxidoreductase [Helicobacter mustelae]CBG40183.1 putative pyridine nucleotide-disulphide oxidoreductase [Helicobacter mustelae 12198]SQH71686.1 pyridine nucleotide-disulphide oxidoreductase [Helicobacter mustelae]STP12811.1 pyridine nucleotide-disulphide oxidoreductase [Helicobacter mustelae]